MKKMLILQLPIFLVFFWGTSLLVEAANASDWKESVSKMVADSEFVIFASKAKDQTSFEILKGSKFSKKEVEWVDMGNKKTLIFVFKDRIIKYSDSYEIEKRGDVFPVVEVKGQEMVLFGEQVIDLGELRAFLGSMSELPTKK